MPVDEAEISTLELARRLFKEYYSRCFWHWKPDREITQPMIPAMVRELCTYGGHQGMLAAAKVQRTEKA